ncbi:hypothetical protein [Streptomyces sp. NPDC060002]|uniref:hypothetical protein n=1 Tax=Streptomyces sp. NPDC060002 TaxID=3347033 RepID=UPI0036CED2BB
MRAEMVAKVEIPQPGLSRLKDGRGWYLQEQGILKIFDLEFAPVRQYDLGRHVSSFAVSPDLARVVVGRKDQIRLVDEHGNVLWSVQHTPWGTGYSYSGSCEFSADGNAIWATVPETELGSEEEDGLWEDDEDDEDVETAASSGDWSAPESWGDQWWVIDAATGKVIGRKWLGCEATGSVTLRHPDQVHMGLSVGEGQDGSRIYWGSIHEGSPQVVTTGDVSRSLVDLHPDGFAYLTLPRDSEGITIHDFSSKAAIAHRPNGDFLESGEWPLHAQYLDRGTVLLETVDAKWNCARHLAFDARSLEFLGEVTYPTGVSRSAFHSVHAGTWATSDASGLYQWRLDA